jgi:HEAT repeat protein
LERASDPALPAVAQTSGATEPESIHAQKAPAPTATVETSARHAFALEQEYAVRTATIERRGEIIREIAQLETAQGISALRRLFDRERREELRLEIVSAVGAIENEQLLPAKLQFFSRATEPQTPRLLREVSAIALSELDDPRAEALLRGLQSDPDAELRATVRQLLDER